MSVPSLEADLRAARESAGVSVEEIQHETRIPADVVHRFEEGKLLNDPAFNDVYLKAFLRAYAGAVGLMPSQVIEAYSAVRSGTYRGELGGEDHTTEEEPAESPAPISEPEAREEPAPAEVPQAASPQADVPGAKAPSAEASRPASPPRGPAPAVAALSQSPEPKPPATPVPPEPASKHRVGTPLTGSAARSFDRSWGTIIVVTVVVVVAVAGVLWLLFRDTAPEPEGETVVAADTVGAEGAAPIDTLETEQPEPASGPALSLPIRVTILAGGDGLQAFRTTEIPDARRPYWVEPGDELSVESDEGVILWGEGAEGMDPDEVTLRWQGFEWKPQEGQVLRITPATGQRLLDSLQTAGARRLP